MAFSYEVFVRRALFQIQKKQKKDNVYKVRLMGQQFVAQFYELVLTSAEVRCRSILHMFLESFRMKPTHRPRNVVPTLDHINLITPFNLFICLLNGTIQLCLQPQYINFNTFQSKRFSCLVIFLLSTNTTTFMNNTAVVSERIDLCVLEHYRHK